METLIERNTSLETICAQADHPEKGGNFLPVKKAEHLTAIQGSEIPRFSRPKK